MKYKRVPKYSASDAPAYGEFHIPIKTFRIMNHTVTCSPLFNVSLCIYLSLSETGKQL